MGNLNFKMLSFLLFFLVIPCVPIVFAHGTDHRIMENTNAVVVAFSYSDGEPMRYAAILVFSPENDKIEYQNGRTDQNGIFTFFPNVAGLWRIEANDGVGHKEQAKIDVSETTADATEPAQKITDRNDASKSASKPLKTVAGISLIGNLCMGVYLWKRKEKGRRNNSFQSGDKTEK